jgi:hypothetical protein
MFYPFSVHFLSIFEHLLTTGVQPGSSFPLAHFAMPRRPGTPASADLGGANKKKNQRGVVSWESPSKMEVLTGFMMFNGKVNYI